MEKMYFNLTNGGPISVYVEDGKVTRIRPMQIPEADYPKPWTVVDKKGRKYSPPKAMRLAQNVHAERNRLYSEDRILYPLKRVDFDPKGERNPQNRGKSGYERISWDEALDIVAGEIQRVIDTYGSHAITGLTSSHHNWGIVGYKMGPFHRFTGMLNHTPVYDNPDSWEGWLWGAAHMYGFFWRLGQPEQFDLLQDTLKHSDMIIFWSNDPDSTHGIYGGQESNIWRVWLKESGIKCIFIDPFYNYTNAVMDGTWIPIRPGTDAAMQAAIAYVWFKDDTYDHDFVKRKTVGIEEFKKYIMGDEDGIPKTPEWAEKECGVPARQIRALAKEWASKRTVISAGARGGEGGACRAAYSTEHPRMLVALSAMQGIGKPGVSIWGTTMGCPANYDWFPGYADPDSKMGYTRFAKRKLAKEITTKQRLYRLTLPDAILNGSDKFISEGFCGSSLEQQFIPHEYPIEGPIKLFYRYGGSFIGTMSDTNKWVKMYQSDRLEFVVNQDCWWGSETGYADIILPACTNLERNDIAEWCNSGGYTSNGQIGVNWRVLVRMQKCIEPLGESKSDYEIFSLIADRLGMGELYTEGKTEDDWARGFWEISDFNRIMSFDEFEKKGYLVVPVPEDYKETPALRWFYEDRECDTPDVLNIRLGTDRAKELGTYTGKIEFVSESLKSFDPDDWERPVVPHYIPSWEGWNTPGFEKYPFQFISPHPRFSFHTHYDKHTKWLDEIPQHRKMKDGYPWWIVRINTADAKKKGIGDGDLVELFNDRGSVVCIAELTERLPEGVIHSYGCSAKYDPVEPVPGAVDYGGCINLLTSGRMISKNAPGMTPNSCRIDIRRWEGVKK